MQKPCPKALFCDHFTPGLQPDLTPGKMSLFHVSVSWSPRFLQRFFMFFPASLYPQIISKPVLGILA